MWQTGLFKFSIAPAKQKANSEFKPVQLRLNIFLLSNPAIGGGVG